MKAQMTSIPSPIGMLHLAWNERALTALEFEEGRDRLVARLAKKNGATNGGSALPPEIKRALERYFDGDLSALDSVRVEAEGTDFQKKVWAELRKIPAGTTISYAELARRIGNPKAVRAVGAANGRNPVGLVVPCHRVIGADGGLTGYGGGLDRKAWLLDHEKKHAGRSKPKA